MSDKRTVEQRIQDMQREAIRQKVSNPQAPATGVGLPEIGDKIVHQGDKTREVFEVKNNTRTKEVEDSKTHEKITLELLDMESTKDKRKKVVEVTGDFWELWKPYTPPRGGLTLGGR